MNENDKFNFLKFILTFKTDDIFYRYLEYYNLTNEEFNELYNLRDSEDINKLLSDIFYFLYDLDGVEEVVSYSRERFSPHLEVCLRRTVYFKSYSLVVCVTIDSRSYDEYSGVAVLSVC